MKANKMQIILRFIGFTIKLSAMYLEVVSNWYHSIKTLLTLFLKFKTFLKRIQFRSSLHRTIKLSKLFKQLLMNYCNKLVMRGVARELGGMETSEQIVKISCQLKKIYGINKANSNGPTVIIYTSEEYYTTDLTQIKFLGKHL